VEKFTVEQTKTACRYWYKSWTYRPRVQQRLGKSSKL